MELVLILGGLGFLVEGAAGFLYLGWIRQYVQDYGGRVVFYEYSFWALRDIEEAAKIAEREGQLLGFLLGSFCFSGQG